jgi:hypothetical protein
MEKKEKGVSPGVKRCYYYMHAGVGDKCLREAVALGVL